MAIKYRCLTGLLAALFLATCLQVPGSVCAQTGPDGKKCVEVKKPLDAPPKREPLAGLDADNKIIQVNHPFEEPIFNPQAPKDTADAPATICEDCELLLSQIQHRIKTLETPCDEPIELMNALLKMPKTYLQWEKEQADLWAEAIKEVQSSYVSFKELETEYLALYKMAADNNLIISPQDLAQYDQARQRLNDPDAPPLTMGNGIPAGFFVHTHEQAALVESMRRDQERIQAQFMAERRKFEEALPEFKEKLAWYDQTLQGKFNDLNEIRQTLSKYQSELAGMHMSGKYEHCLGGGFKTSMDYTVKSDDGREQRGAAWGLPGMNITLPQPRELKLPADMKLAAPEPLPHFRLKQDGIQQAAQDRKLLESLANAEMLVYAEEYGSLLNYIGSWMMWAGHDLWVGKGGDESLALDASDAIRNMADSVISWTLDPLHDAIFEKPFHEVVDSFNVENTMAALKSVFIDMPKGVGEKGGEFVGGIFEGIAQGGVDWWRMGETLQEIEELMDEQRRLVGKDSPQDNAKAMAIAERLRVLWGEMHKGGQGIDTIITTVGTSATLYKAVHGTKAAIAGAIKQKQLLQAQMAQLAAWQKAGRITTAQLDDMTRAAQSSIDTLSKQIDDAVAVQKEAMQKLSAELDEAAKLQQARLTAPQPPKPFENVVTATSQQIESGAVIGKGTVGIVKDLGEDKVAKVFNNRWKDNKLLFDDELQGLKNLNDTGIPHVQATQGGLVNIGGDDFHVIIKDKFAPNQKTLHDVLESRNSVGRKLTRQEQIEALEFYNEATKRGIVFGDPNSGNLLKETLPDGSFRYLAVEGGSVIKVDPAQARQMMNILLDPKTLTEKVSLDDLIERGRALENAFSTINQENIAQQFFETGFSLGDMNIAKHIDPELLETFLKNPDKWDDMVAQTRRAQQLVQQKAGHLTGLEQQLQQAARKTENVAQNAEDDFMRQLREASDALHERDARLSSPTPVPEGSGPGAVEIPSINPLGPQSSLDRFTIQNLEVAAMAA